LLWEFSCVIKSTLGPVEVSQKSLLGVHVPRPTSHQPRRSPQRKVSNARAVSQVADVDRLFTFFSNICFCKRTIKQ
jgi:hypothetical protein